MKAGVRFLTYDYFKSKLSDSQGKISAPRSLLGVSYFIGDNLEYRGLMIACLVCILSWIGSGDD
jgi:hypothetical protein